MEARPVAHPSDYILKAFDSGKLDNAGAQAVLAHLEVCLDCRGRAVSLSGDGILKRLRAAHPSSATTPNAAALVDTGATALPHALKAADSQATTPHEVPSVPPELREHPQYDILRELGYGGMGVVYLAKNKKMQRFEVLKVVNRQLLNQPGAVERFLREIRSAANLNHASIVTAYSMPEAGELLVFAMEYVPGEDLAKLVKANGPLPVTNACFYIYQVAKGLQHAHEKKMVHRDIKPGNLIVTRMGKNHIVKILDFGLAKATREEEGTNHDLTGVGVMLGTPAFIAPEQTLDAANADIRADIYSLGCTLYFLLTGHPPFQEKSLFDLLSAHHSKEAAPLTQLRADVPAPLAAVVAKMMAKELSRRYQTPDEVARELQPFFRAGLRAVTIDLANDDGVKAVPPQSPPTANLANVFNQKTRLDLRSEVPSVPPPAAVKVEITDRQATQARPLHQSLPANRGSTGKMLAVNAVRVTPPPPSLVPSRSAGAGRRRKALLWLLLAVTLLGAGGMGAWYLVRLGSAAKEDAANPDVARAAFGRPLVVLVGVDKCADNSIRGRMHPENDAKAVYDLFYNRKHLGVASSRVRLLLGTPDAKRKSQPASKENILAALKWLADEAGPDDFVVFGFFGPGVPLRSGTGRHAYFAADSTSRQRAKNAVLASEIAAALKPLRSRRFCALLDVDFQAADEIDASEESPFDSGAWSHFLGRSDYTADLRWPGRSLFIAANGLTCLPVAGGQGTFAQVLLDGLGGKADHDGYEPDGLVTNWELHKHLAQELSAANLRIAAKERPASYTAFIGEDSVFALTENPDAAPAAHERLKKFNALAASDKKIGEIGDEGKTILSLMPRLEHQRRLRKEYQALTDKKLNAEQFLTKRAAILESMKLSPEAARTFAEKVIEATKVVRDKYVHPVNQGDLVMGAIRGLYRGMDEKMPNTLARSLTQIHDMTEPERLALLIEARQQLGDRESLRSHKDIDMALEWMLYRLGPNNAFYTPDNLKNARQQFSGQFKGIGVTIRQNTETDRIDVTSPIYNSPAYKAGIRAGDTIISITREVDAEGKPLPAREITSTKGMTTGQAAKKMTGKPGTRVTLTVRRPGVEKPMEFTIERGAIHVETTFGVKRKPDDTWDFWIDADNKIGYIRLTQFAETSLAEIKSAVESLQQQGMKGLVLDLRFNSGGLLNSARDISDLFIGNGVIYSIRQRGQAEQQVFGKSAGSILNFPIACLVNGGTASGTEILAASLQDHGRAKIIGERTYGMGSVQHICDFERKDFEVISQLKLTTSLFFRPSRKNIDKSQTAGKEEDPWGVLPDKFVRLSWSERNKLQKHLEESEIIQPPGKPSQPAQFRDKQLDAALEFLRDKIKY